MKALDWSGLVSLALVGLTFYFVRNIRAYVLTGALVVLGTAAVTLLMDELSAEWVVLVTGLGLFAFGLLIVRVMFIRSVSLNMLRSMDLGTQETFGEDIGGRLSDMRAFHLIQTSGGENALTGFGRFVAGVVAVLYGLLRIKS